MAEGNNPLSSYPSQNICSFLSIPFYKLRCLTLKKQLELENVRLEGVEKILDSKLLTSDYSQYLKEMSLDPHRHHIMEEGEPSTGGKAEGVIITGEDRPEILATAAAKSTPSPLSSHPAPSSGLAHQSSFSSQNVNTAAAASSVGGSSSIERLVGSSSIPPSTEPHAESKRSKHKKDKVSELRSPAWVG